MRKVITSFQNPLIKNIQLLGEKPRARREQNRMVIEGIREVGLAVGSGFRITSLLYVPEMISPDKIETLVGNNQDVEITEITPEIFNRIAYRQDSGGVVALAEPRRLSFDDLHLTETPLLLILETVEKPGNLGALLRTADAANLDAVIICDPQTDIYNPNAIRSGIGCIFTMPVVTATSFETISWLNRTGIRICATTPSAEKFYHETDFRKPSAIVMGSEAFGLSPLWFDKADELIKIPMMGKIDSMNVSASAAVVVFEALRQRGFRGGPPGPHAKTWG